LRARPHAARLIKVARLAPLGGTLASAIRAVGGWAHPSGGRGEPVTVSERIMGAEAHWLMGSVMPRQFLEEVGKYLHHVAPEREEELIDAIRARAEEIARADKDLAVDGRSEGTLAICAVVLASYETLLPVFDGDERRAILYLQHAMGPVLRRPYDL